MNRTLNMLAMDYGASGGRAMLGSFDGSRLQLKEIHRFDNTPVRLGGRFYWDFLRLYHELLQGIGQYNKRYGDGLASIAVDTWGVDVGFLDGRDGCWPTPTTIATRATKACRRSRPSGFLRKRCTG